MTCQQTTNSPPHLSIVLNMWVGPERDRTLILHFPEPRNSTVPRSPRIGSPHVANHIASPVAISPSPFESPTTSERNMNACPRSGAAFESAPVHFHLVLRCFFQFRCLFTIWLFTVSKPCGKHQEQPVSSPRTIRDTTIPDTFLGKSASPASFSPNALTRRTSLFIVLSFKKILKRERLAIFLLASLCSLLNRTIAC